MSVALTELTVWDDRRSRQDGVGGPKGPGSVHDYPQTDGYSAGTMTS